MILILQLTSYGFFLCVFAVVAFFSARRWGLGGMLAGHFVIAAIIFYLDVNWVKEAMNADGWDGTPDFDIVFEIGLLIRIVLTNVLLLPVTYMALRIRKASRVKVKELSLRTS